ncbi:MAG: helix-turn-helix domain-containing protein, partial [Actinobacteria bacterium]|nr:helix-turn-helix domain-containing protein [Actinomycetota bacterium]
MQRTRTGIGPALRKARLHRGKSLQEASRETRIRADQLDALEREAFDALAGDVYVRGFLRTYSQYLGLRPDKVLSAYEERYGAPEAAPVEPRRSSVRLEGALAARPHRPHRARLVAVAGAGVVLLVAGALGILSGDRPSPTAATPPARPPSGAVAVTQGVTVAMLALEEVRVTV